MIIDLSRAMAALKNNDVVAIPTETVYGLAGCIDSAEAIQKIFSVKKRPFFDPLIVHVATVGQAQTLTTKWTKATDLLAATFWPGPLTLVLPKTNLISDLISSGLETVGIRCPNHQLTLELIQKMGIPLAAPSANLFGKTSPTEANHVESEFQGSVNVLDGGPCQIGIESTVLWLDDMNSCTRWKVLRLGAISANAISDVFNKNQISHLQVPEIAEKLSPGHTKHHYMPSIPIFLIKNARLTPEQIIPWANKEILKLPLSIDGVSILRPTEFKAGKEFQLPKDPKNAARTLYGLLRNDSKTDADHLYFYLQPWHSTDDWLPILDRLSKAASLIYPQDP